jgi:hypothetical protein
MGTSELNEAQPIISFLAPTDAQTATFGQPGQGALHYPATGRKLGLAWNGAFFDDRFTASAPLLDVSDVARHFHKLMDIRIVIAFIHAEMLLHLVRIRSWHNDRHNQLVRQPLVMDIGPTDLHRQRCATLIDPRRSRMGKSP